MPKGPPPHYTRRDCRFDGLIVSALAATGPGQAVYYQGIEDPARAKDIKQGLYRCARHRKISVWVEWQHSGEWTTSSHFWPPDRQDDGTYTLRFTLASKSTARRRHIAVHGTDRRDWPYNPRQSKTPADIEAWAQQGLNEKGHRVR